MESETHDEERIAWHPAFFEAIQMELDEYSQDLQFIYEYQLTTEPLRIDVLIIKKSRDITIKKNIASIFRKENIVEYKSPDDYVSVNDFYLVYGYACLYKSLIKADIKELTLTFVESRYPRELIEHLRQERGFMVEETSPGIYTVRGDILPIQVIDSRKLSGDENIWLKDLDNKLKAPEILRITAEIDRRGKAARIKAYLDAITRANRKILNEEVARMSRDVMASLSRTFEEVGLAESWIARGEARGITVGEARGEARGITRGEEKKAAEIAGNMLKRGFSVEQTAELSGLDVVKVNEYYRTLEQDIKK